MKYNLKLTIVPINNVSEKIFQPENFDDPKTWNFVMYNKLSEIVSFILGKKCELSISANVEHDIYAETQFRERFPKFSGMNVYYDFEQANKELISILNTYCEEGYEIKQIDNCVIFQKTLDKK